MENIFGDAFKSPKMSTPKDILAEFKKQLERESGEAVTAEIRPTEINFLQNLITSSFAVKSKATNYSYSLFTISHDVLNYPCVIMTENDIINQAGLTDQLTSLGPSIMGIKGVPSVEENQLRILITKIFQTPRCINILKAIYSQS